MNLLGIDIGTTSLKAAAFTEDSTMLERYCEEYTLETSGDIVEFDGEKYWDIVRGEIEKVRAELSVDALSVDTQCETLILTDENGTPVRPAIVWLDNRADEEAKIIEAHFGHKRVYEVTGQPEITATWPAAKLLWNRRTPKSATAADPPSKGFFSTKLGSIPSIRSAACAD